MARDRMQVTVTRNIRGLVTTTNAQGLEEAGKVADVSSDHVKRLLRTGGVTRRGFSFARQQGKE